MVDFDSDIEADVEVREVGEGDGLLDAGKVVVTERERDADTVPDTDAATDIEADTDAITDFEVDTEAATEVEADTDAATEVEADTEVEARTDRVGDAA